MRRKRDGNRIGSVEDNLLDGITYDSLGRMQYHPDFHPNHGKPFTEDDLIYLCKYHGIDDIRSLSFAVGKTEHVVATKLNILRKDGRYDRYREMPLDRWEQVAKRDTTK